MLSWIFFKDNKKLLFRCQRLIAYIETSRQYYSDRRAEYMAFKVQFVNHVQGFNAAIQRLEGLDTTQISPRLRAGIQKFSNKIYDWDAAWDRRLGNFMSFISKVSIGLGIGSAICVAEDKALNIVNKVIDVSKQTMEKVRSFCTYLPIFLQAVNLCLSKLQYQQLKKLILQLLDVRFLMKKSELEANRMRDTLAQFNTALRTTTQVIGYIQRGQLDAVQRIIRMHQRFEVLQTEITPDVVLAIFQNIDVDCKIPIENKWSHQSSIERINALNINIPAADPPAPL